MAQEEDKQQAQDPVMASTDTIDANRAQNSDDPKQGAEEDASRKEVALYAFGNIEGSMADQFFGIFNNVMVIAMHINPLLVGMIGAIKTLWDSITDPIMAHVTDNTRSRWGRRRPYILFGGVFRILLLVMIVAFFPRDSQITTNEVMEAQRIAQDAIKTAETSHSLSVKAIEQYESLTADEQDKLKSTLSSIPAEIVQARSDFLAAKVELEKDFEARRQIYLQKAADAEKLAATIPESRRETDKSLIEAKALTQNANDRLNKSKELLDKIKQGQRVAIAAEYATTYALGELGADVNNAAESKLDAQMQADVAYREAGLAPMPIFSLDYVQLPKPKESKGFLESVTGAFDEIRAGIQAFSDPYNAEQRTIILYFLVATLLFTTLTTIQSVPYYALGIELCPSYEGRTRVVAYRSVFNKIANILQQLIPIFCFSLIFTTAIEGLFWVAIIACVIGIPSTVLMCWFTKERTHPEIKSRKDRPSIFRSMWEIAKNSLFLRILGLYCFIGLTNGIFSTVGFYLNVYWVMGSALAGARLGFWINLLAIGLTLAAIPPIYWACNKFQKHKVLTAAIIWMAIGTVMKWWCMNPDHPEYQFILPFFFSIGINAVYMILPTMMADVTDVDELEHGVRREGMFGAVMAFIMKLIFTMTPILSGAIIVISGFDASLEYRQEAETIFHMRVLFSFIPGIMLLLALVLLWKYPLNSTRVAEIKEELRKRHLRHKARSEQA